MRLNDELMENQVQVITAMAIKNLKVFYNTWASVHYL